MTESVGSRLRTALAAKQWTQSDLVRETGIDKNTISAIANNRSQARTSTLDKIEEALGLTRGTLAGSGEDAEREASEPLDLTAIGDAQLMAELSYRLESAERLMAQFRDELASQASDARIGMHLRVTWEHWLSGAQHADGEPQRDLAKSIHELQHLEESGGLDPVKQDILETLQAEALMHALAENFGYDVHPGNGTSRQRPRSEASGQAVTPNVTPEAQTLAARHGRSRGKALRDELDGLGEESQDDQEQE